MVATAAVSDFRPSVAASDKVKKDIAPLMLELDSQSRHPRDSRRAEG